MKATKKSKAEKLQPSHRDLAEEALEIAIKNAALSSEIIKALRLTCKRTKVAADARVKEFYMPVHWEPEAVRRSGLLNNITKLSIKFNLMPSEIRSHGWNYSQVLSRSLGLLNLAVDVCKSLEVLQVTIQASDDTLHACGCILGNSRWTYLQELTLAHYYRMPNIFSGMLARPGSLPALRKLCCRDPSVADIKCLESAPFAASLTKLSLEWPIASHVSNTAPAMMAAMRSLMQKATSLDSLALASCTFEFLDCEHLASLKSLTLEGMVNPAAQLAAADFAPALARPWTTLESLHINGAFLEGSDLIRIFEAEDTLPALKELTIDRCNFDVEGLGCVRRPHLKEFNVLQCIRGQELIFKLSQLMKVDVHALPSLRVFKVNLDYEQNLASATKAISEFLSCPQMAALETFSICDGDISGEEVGILLSIANYCPKLKYLDLQHNHLGRPAAAMLLGYGEFLGAWPELQKLGILEQMHQAEGENEDDDTDINRLAVEHPYMPLLDMETAFRRAWPGLECF